MQPLSLSHFEAVAIIFRFTQSKPNFSKGCDCEPKAILPKKLLC
jgi:hypothetical protein